MIVVVDMGRLWGSEGFSNTTRDSQKPCHCSSAGFSSWTCQRAAVFDHHNWRRWGWWWPSLLKIFVLVISKKTFFFSDFHPGFLLLFATRNRWISNGQLSFANLEFGLLQLCLCRQELQEHPRRRQNTTAGDLCSLMVWLYRKRVTRSMPATHPWVKHWDSIECVRSGNRRRGPSLWLFGGNCKCLWPFVYGDWWYIEGGQLPSEVRMHQTCRAYDIILYSRLHPF